MEHHFFCLIDIDWRTLLLGEEKWGFLAEVALRSLIMFLVLLFSLRILGKRSVSQLSVFELGVIIGLGSASGDPMFYKDVGLLPGMMVFLVIISLYRFMTFLINRDEKIEKVLEGNPVCLIRDGRFILKNFESEPIAHEEFFAQLRVKSVAHLGQVREAIIETNGMVSVFYFEDDAVQWGLPIIPDQYAMKSTMIREKGIYACAYCGQVEEISKAVENHICPLCGKEEWVNAINQRRLA